LVPERLQPRWWIRHKASGLVVCNISRIQAVLVIADMMYMYRWM